MVPWVGAGQSVIILDGLPYLELNHAKGAGLTVLVPLSERPRGQDRTEPPHSVQALPETYRLQTSDESVYEIHGADEPYPFDEPQ